MARCPTCYRRLSSGAVCPTDGDRAPPESTATQDVEPPEIPGFVLREGLGRGATSTVWAGIQTKDARAVAVKVARAATDHLTERFEREAAILERLPPGNAPELLQSGRLPNGRSYLAMERLGGDTLARYLERLQKPDESTSIALIAAAIIKNLEALHGVELCHYDLKPSNILLTEAPPDPKTMLIDFGLTALTSVVVGTAEYMAPERIAGERAESSADIYSFGVVLYELLTLRVPFAGDRTSIERGHIALRPAKPSQFAAVSSRLEQLTLRCLAKNPNKRPSLKEISAQLEQTEKGADADSTTSAAEVRPRQRHSSREPVAILVSEIESPAALAEIRRRGGVVARQTGTRYVCAFASALCQEPAQAALGAGEALARRGRWTALHVAELRVRARDDERLRLYGAAVERPESWLPDSIDGLVLTDEFAAVVDLPLDPAGPGFHRLAERDVESSSTGPLVGREEIAAAAEASIERSFTERCPELFTIVGVTGLGKSRLAAELLALGSSMDNVRTVHFQARTSGDNQHRLLTAIGAAELADIPDLDPARDVGGLLAAASRVRPTAVVIDDAHRLSGQLCDAIEYATLNRVGTPLWIAVTVNPRFVGRRRQWGSRANRHEQIELEPLGEREAMALAAELLKPAEYPPADLLRRLANWAGGNPFFLVEIIRALKRQGIIRERESRSFYVATADLENLPAIPASQWLATRLLEGMPSELARLTRLCAILGPVFRRDEVAWIQDAAEKLPAASSPIDLDVGLAELERSEVMVRRRDGWSFAHGAVADAITHQLDSAVAVALRSAAMEFWREPAATGEELAMLRFANHAAASGSLREAGETYLRLADRARAEHRAVDADQFYSSALEFLDDGPSRARILGGRGEVRYRMQRLSESVDDLGEAIELARELGDSRLEANWLLAQSTALDWADRYAESAERVDRANAIALKLDDPSLIARCVVARGRTRWRAENIEEAIELLDRGVALAAAQNDYEYQVIGLLLLPLALVYADRRDEAIGRFAEVIELCEQAGDRLHLCAAYGNRMFLWRNQPDNAVDDLRRANELAREVGQAGAERVTTHNLAEILFWSGDDTESLALAERSFALQRRLFPTPVANDPLLVARIRAGRQEWEQVRETLEWIAANVDESELAPSNQVAIEMLELSLETRESSSDAAERWQELLARARDLVAAEEYLELLYTRAHAAAAVGATEALELAISEAHTKLVGCSVWRARFSSLPTSTVSL